MKHCYRVLLTDYRGTEWQPVISARDTDDLAVKVNNIYPGAYVHESFILHEIHDQHAMVLPERTRSLVGIVGVSSHFDRRKA